MADPPVYGQADPPFIELQSVDSTNNYARHLIHEGLAQHGTAIFAHEQVAGRGQRGRTWQASKGLNIILTVILKPVAAQNRQAFPLMASIALATYDFFSKYAGDDTRVKWPNDIYWQDRKAGGILIENIVSQGISVNEGFLPVNENRDWTLAGIGINVNETQFPENLKNPVSLKQITGKNFNPMAMSRELAAGVIKRFEMLSLNDTENLRQLYNATLYKNGQLVKLKKDNRVFEGLVKGVSKEGKLQVQTGIDEEFDFGEIEWT